MKAVKITSVVFGLVVVLITIYSLRPSTQEEILLKQAEKLEAEANYHRDWGKTRWNNDSIPEKIIGYYREDKLVEIDPTKKIYYSIFWFAREFDGGNTPYLEITKFTNGVAADSNSVRVYIKNGEIKYAKERDKAFIAQYLQAENVLD
jgi:hypothetical protein